jgi:UDP-N-acetyl-D-mannosaminuronate dehydrogenase
MTRVLIVGAGEIGSALGKVLADAGIEVDYYDVDESKRRQQQDPHGSIVGYDFMHVCFGYTEEFPNQVVGYIQRFKPKITVINSTIPVGLTRHMDPLFGAIEYNQFDYKLAHSPVRGRHFDLVHQLKMYKKFVGAIDEKVGREVAAHFWRAGIPSMYVGKPEITELGKLLDTSYYGAILAIHQEFSRLCDAAGVSMVQAFNIWNEDANANFKKIDGCDCLIKPTLSPGFIGEHCVMPNLNLLDELYGDRSIGNAPGKPIPSFLIFRITDFIKSSNWQWKEGK